MATHELQRYIPYPRAVQPKDYYSKVHTTVDWLQLQTWVMETYVVYLCK